jgi:hypothetical protein
MKSRPLNGLFCWRDGPSFVDEHVYPQVPNIAATPLVNLGNLVHYYGCSRPTLAIQMAHGQKRRQDGIAIAAAHRESGKNQPQHFQTPVAGGDGKCFLKYGIWATGPLQGIHEF